MASRPILAVAALLALVPTPEARAQKAVFVVRHAEKQSNDADTPLSPRGQRRAAVLAEMLNDAGVSAVYVSPALRTRQTAAPLLEDLERRGTPVTPGELPEAPTPEQVAEAVREIRGRHAEGVVLIVSHSGTVEPLVEALGGQPVAPIGNTYDNLFVVVPRTSGATVLHLHFDP
jgi:phosphohistidine phosphatase SixA